jgi:hypothetical protein
LQQVTSLLIPSELYLVLGHLLVPNVFWSGTTYVFLAVSNTIGDPYVSSWA